VLGVVPSWGLDSLFQQVPSGKLVHKDCIHQIENGAVISHKGDKIVVSNGESKMEYSACPHPSRNLRHGPAWKTWGQYRNANKITYLTGTWDVPSMPSSVSGQILYFWNGVEPDDNSAVLQPVLQWGFTPAGGGDYWAVSSWYVSADHGSFFTALINCSIGDEVLGTLSIENNGTWIVTGENTRTSATTSFSYVPFSTDYTYAYEVLEAYNVDSSCNLYPPDGVVHFTNIAVEVAGQKVTPTWTPKTQTNECNEQTKVLSATAVDIVFNTS